MNGCINTNTAEFQTLLKQSGLPEFYISAICGQFLEKYNRFPYLDEINGVDSSNYLSTQLRLNNGSTSIKNILSMTGLNTIEESQIFLNNIFRDQEINIFPLTNDAIVRINKRPINSPVTQIVRHSNVANPRLIYTNVINKLNFLYGTKINTEIGENFKNKTYYIEDGKLYVNPDMLSMNNIIPMALLLSEFRESDGYKSLLPRVAETNHFYNLVKMNPKRNPQDLLEEALIEQINRTMRFGTSELTIQPKLRYELQYALKRTLDTILMGETSVKGFPNETLFNSSIRDLCSLVNSSLDVVTYAGTDINGLFDEIQAKDPNVKEYCYV